MYLTRQPRGMHLQAHTRTRSLKDLYAFDDGEAREVMPLSRLVVTFSQLVFLKLYLWRKGCSEWVIVITKRYSMFGKTQKSTLTSIHGTSGSGDMLYGSHECLASCRVSCPWRDGIWLVMKRHERYTPSSFEIEFYNWQYSGIVTKCQYR